MSEPESHTTRFAPDLLRGQTALVTGASSDGRPIVASSVARSGFGLSVGTGGDAYSGVRPPWSWWPSHRVE